MMVRIEIPLTATKITNLAPDIAAALDDFLRSKGYTNLGVTTQLEPAPAIVVEADTDPTADIKAWAPIISAERDQLLKARALYLAYRDKVLANQTVTTQDANRALAALITVVDRLLTV